MPINQNPHLATAVAEYREALRQVRLGQLCNASMAREKLRLTYRLIAGKPLYA